MKTNSTTEREQRERSSDNDSSKAKNPSETNGVKSPSSETSSNVVSLEAYRAKKDSVKQVFKDSLDNDQVMRRYKINQPTLEQRQERIKQSIDRINKMLKEIKETQ